MFKLFFDIAGENDFINKREWAEDYPIKSKYDDYEQITRPRTDEDEGETGEVNLYDMEDLYDIGEISRLFPDELWMETQVNNFTENLEGAPDIDENDKRKSIMKRCSNIYTNGNYLEQLKIKRYILKEIMISYQKKKIILELIKTNQIIFLNSQILLIILNLTEMVKT